MNYFINKNKNLLQKKNNATLNSKIANILLFKEQFKYLKPVFSFNGKNSESSFFNLGLFLFVILTYISSLFLIGLPYRSMVVMLISYFSFFFFIFRLLDIPFCVKNCFLITLLAFTFLGVFKYSFTFPNHIVYNLFAIKITLYLLIISIFLSAFTPKMIYPTKLLFISLLLSCFFLGIYLCQVKIYFFDAINLTLVKENYPLIPNPIHLRIFSAPYKTHITQVYWSLKKNIFLTNFDSTPFVLDFSNSEQVQDFIFHSSRIEETKYLFDYIIQMTLFNLNWLDIHLHLVFV